MQIARNIDTADKLMRKGAYQSCVSMLTCIREDLELRGFTPTVTKEVQLLRDISHLYGPAITSPPGTPTSELDGLEDIALVIFNDNGSELEELAEAMYEDVLQDWNHYCAVKH